MAEPNPGFEPLRRICAAALRRERIPAAPAGDSATGALALAERHRVVPLWAAGFSAGPPDSVRRRVLALAQQTVRLEQELGAISACLAAAGADFLVRKGPAMARQAYPVADWRAFDDLDLWVHSRDLDAAVAALAAVGYRRTLPLAP